MDTTMLDTTMLIKDNVTRPKPPLAATFNSIFLAWNFVQPARPQACDGRSSILIRRAPSTGREQSRRIKGLLKMQNKPNLNIWKFAINDLLKRIYLPPDTWYGGKNEPNSNPIRTQYKANSNPIRTHFERTKPKFGPHKWIQNTNWIAKSCTKAQGTQGSCVPAVTVITCVCLLGYFEKRSV
jgi:hypothetical protein